MARESKDVKIECEFVTKRKDGTAICIRDGSTSRDLLGKQTANEFWIQLQFINDSSYESINDLHRGEKIEIFIPEWFAIERGLV